MTLKDLQKRIRLETPIQEIKLFEILTNKPFWIWDVQEHKREDIKTKGDCCFNHIIRLPKKENKWKPIFEYQKLLYGSLFIPNLQNPLNQSIIQK